MPVSDMRLLLVAFAMLVGACSSNSPATAVERAPGTAEVTIPAELKSCSIDAECTLVRTGCDACCQRQAINATQVDRFREEFAEACAGYSGPVCDCIETPAEARCVDRRCTLVPLD